MQKPKAPIKKEVIKCKIARAKARAEEAAKEVVEHSAKAEVWENICSKTHTEELTFSKRDPLQKAMVSYATTMGIATEGNESSNGFSKWARTLSGYIQEKYEDIASASVKVAGSHVSSPLPNRPTPDPTPNGDGNY